jgi:hypothetical protein
VIETLPFVGHDYVECKARGEVLKLTKKARVKHPERQDRTANSGSSKRSVDDVCNDLISYSLESNFIASAIGSGVIKSLEPPGLFPDRVKCLVIRSIHDES